jgi:hypothetical protein
MTCTADNYPCDEIREDEMGRVCGTCVTEDFGRET